VNYADIGIAIVVEMERQKCLGETRGAAGNVRPTGLEGYRRAYNATIN
jgi:hypothetical protein